MNQKQKGLAPIIIIGIVILVLVMVGGGGYYLVNNNKQAKLEKDNQASEEINLEKGEVVEKSMLDQEARQYFHATEIVNNSLPDYIEFWTEAYCPGEGTPYDYVMPEGYDISSCDKNLQGIGIHGGCPTCVMSLIKAEKGVISSFPLSQTIKPKFIQKIQKTENISFNLEYNNPFRDYYGFEQGSIKDENGESFVSLSNDSQRDRPIYKYLYTIFSPEGSHSYGGSGLKVNNLNSKFSIAYIGLKINDLNLITNLNTEVVFSTHDAYEYRPRPIGYNQKNIITILNDFFSIEKVYACGPSNTVQLVGESDLELFKKESGVQWYSVKNPIKLYDLPLGLCYEDNGEIKTEEYGCEYCKYCDNDCDFYSIHDQNHYDCISSCSYDCFKWNQGKAMRFNIVYTPNNKTTGFLKIQVANIILQDEQGNYFEPNFDNIYSQFANYYKAYLYSPG